MGLPQGTVTFLFTDLEGSTRLWEAHPGEMRDALARHDTIVREAVESHGGVVFSTMGDGMAAVFASARDAVRAVVAAQVELTAGDWGEVTGPLAARMGLLTDESVLDGEHYLNQPLNRCARLMAAGHGGQALVSGATELLVRDDLPEGCGLLDLGEHRLRDVARPVRIFQLTGPGLRSEFPPLRTLDVPAGNLPVQLSSFVGRVDELAELATAMQQSSLVTVVGVGGVGKTRLALQAAAKQLPSFRDGVWLCELHAAEDAETMVQAVMAAIRARPRPGISLTSSIVEFLRGRSVLLVLDNCEHLLNAAAFLATEVLRTCPLVRVLATSRQALGVEGEQVIGLRPLSLPAGPASMQTVAASDAVSLFVQRASSARSDFRLTSENVGDVVEICRRLDGIPLAIELAAARVAAVRPAEIARLLDERFRLLTRGRSGVAHRQRTLQATVEWSYTLLSETERDVFNCLGVFPASFDAAAAADVASFGGLDQWDVFDSLTTLVDKSMVTVEEGPEQSGRYHLLETMRAYARQQLAAAGQLDLVQARHAEHYAALAEQARPELLGPFQLQWYRRIGAELDNLRTAVMWAMNGSDQTRPFAFRIVAALAFSAASRRDHVGVWAERGLAQASACPPALRAAVIAAAAWSAYFAGDFALAQQRALDALREPPTSDPNGHGMPQALLSQIYARTGQPERGVSIAHKARRDFAEQGVEVYVGYFLALEAMAWIMAGDHTSARQPAMEAVETAGRVQNPTLSALACYAAAHALRVDEPQTALMLIEESLTLTRAGAVDSILGFALSLAAAIRTRNNDLPGALRLLCEAIDQQHQDGNRLGLGVTLQRAAAVLARLGEPEPAAVLSGAVLHHFALSVANIHRDERLEMDEALVPTRRALGKAAYTIALARGAAMGDHDVADYALGELGRVTALFAEPVARAPESPPGMAPLSGREWPSYRAK
jgi:predicted ATPase/class 3 adenylate cyclase